MSEQEQDYLHALRQRRDYLSARIRAKESVEYDTEYDRRERDSLKWAVAKLEEADK